MTITLKSTAEARDGMRQMPHGFQKICTIIKEVGLVNLNRVGLEGKEEGPSPECAKRTEKQSWILPKPGYKLTKRDQVS